MLCIFFQGKSDTGRHHSPRKTSRGAQVGLHRCPILPVSKSKFIVPLLWQYFKRGRRTTCCPDRTISLCGAHSSTAVTALFFRSRRTQNQKYSMCQQSIRKSKRGISFITLLVHLILRRRQRKVKTKNRHSLIAIPTSLVKQSYFT